MNPGKCIIFSAPSGSGKSTLINYLMEQAQETLNLHFSISATSRAPRGTEQDGVEYHFLSKEEFIKRIQEDAFIEYEEVYGGKFYGTLKSEVEKQLEKGENVVFDVDVKGGCNIKQHFGERAISIFIQPPSIEELRNRLVKRGTETLEQIEDRLQRASLELSYADKYDRVIINDQLEVAQLETLQVVKDFISNIEEAPAEETENSTQEE
jgi:guanylate kinase